MGKEIHALGQANVGGSGAIARAEIETPVAILAHQMGLANELAFRARRLESQLFGSAPEEGRGEAPSPDGLMWRIAQDAQMTSGNLSEGIGALTRIAMKMGLE